MKVDRMSMANSLEVRCPMLDHELAELAARIPHAWKLKNGRGKDIFIRAVGHRLPPELLRQPKRGFGVPLASWFRGSLRSFVWDHLTSRAFLDRRMVSPEFVRHLLEEHDRGRRDNHHHLVEAADARIVVPRGRPAANDIQRRRKLARCELGEPMPAELVFWIAVCVPLYAFLGYPLVSAVLRLAIGREVRKAPIQPFVSLLIPAYNEARIIARKIENSLALDYPRDRIEIVIVSDGSSDRTVEIARAAGGVRVLALSRNRGKVAALNAAVPLLRGEIIVFSDASGDAGARCGETPDRKFRRSVGGRGKRPLPGCQSQRSEYRRFRRSLLEIRGFPQEPGVAAGVHSGGSRPSARHSQAAVSLPARRNN